MRGKGKRKKRKGEGERKEKPVLEERGNDKESKTTQPHPQNTSFSF